MLLFYRYQMIYLSCVMIVSPIHAANRRYTSFKNDTKQIFRENEKENSRETTKATVSPQEEDEDKKTLAQQVADGKYGLIQKELFSTPIKRPGILSYEINPEVPRDNINNFGGLKSEEIWLAENHLLVLKGGNFHNNRKKVNWSPIDHYMAPKRRVKIPPNPKVPPPFPIQLVDGGPIDFVKGKRNISTIGNKTREGQGVKFPSLFPPLDPGDLDEDDPRIYYPPPYDFVLEKENHTNHVPPGPLVPGIVLPPPPDIFAPLIPTQATQLSNKEKKPPNREKKPKEHQKTVNETKPKTKLKVEVIEGGWVPISGPPLKTTSRPSSPMINDNGIKNISAPTSIPKSGRNEYYKIIDVPLKKDYDFPETKNPSLYTTTPTPYNGFEPIIFKLRTNVRAPVTPAYSYPIPTFPVNKKIKETYYFYKDPYEIQGKLMEPQVGDFDQNKQNPPIVQKGRKIQFETNTHAPPKLYGEITLKLADEDEKLNPVRLNYFSQSYVKPTQVSQDFQYVYYNRNEYEKDPGGYTYQLPQDPYGTRPIEIFSNEGNNGYKSSPTSKTPIYEYSFSAPGYGTSEPPKIATTPKPIEIEISTHKGPQYSYFEYQTTPKGANIFSYNPSTVQPQLYTTQKPSFPREHAYTDIRAIFNSNNPFNTFLSRNVGSMEEITKKYISLFGQKLNQGSVNEPIATQVPPSRVKPNKPYYEHSFRSMINSEPKDAAGHNFEHQTYDIVTENPYYLKPQTYQVPGYKVQLVKPEPNLQQNLKYEHFYSTAIPQYEQFNYGRDVTRPNHPLPSDIEVNFRQKPVVNSDADFIPSHYVNRENNGNSYISYQLPGSGGHFYFLTPRSVENYHLANSGFRYPNSENSAYRRNRENQTNRKRRKNSESD